MILINIIRMLYICLEWVIFRNILNIQIGSRGRIIVWMVLIMIFLKLLYMFFSVVLFKCVMFRFSVKVKIKEVIIFIIGGMVIVKNGEILCVLLICFIGVFGVIMEGKKVILVK